MVGMMERVLRMNIVVTVLRIQKQPRPLVR